ncbi:hypothetical protein GDO81_021080 [Engystomops pustulosus]|uniref:Poly [ADP-ribose] polymerase n=2 Tax=Engystomops pustulosus TaxID=76066 RepID=A0AAV6ZTU8_ENGPU|nr:hypothetical protein GDO81_021080 [Engystomops pustulosus]
MDDIVMTVCETSVKLKKGNITAQSTDAIVNLNYASLDCHDGVSKAILEGAGPAVRDECKGLAGLPNNGFVVTTGGNLKCCKIIHVIDVQQHNIVASVVKALKASDSNNLASISLPAMGTGTSGLKAEVSIRLMIKGIEDYLTDPSVMTVISEIVIVVFEQNIYDKYHSFFQNFKINNPRVSAFGKSIELIKGDITHQVVDCIVNLTNSLLNQSCGVSGAILSAAGDTVKEECKEIGFLSTNGVAVTSGGNLESSHIMHIIGPTRVPDYEPAIDRILQECHKNKFTSVALPAIGTGMAGVDVEASIKAILSSILNYLSDTLIPSLETILIIVIQEPIYKKYLEVFQAKSKELKTIQREEKIVSAMNHGVKFNFPQAWTDIRTSEFQEVILQQTSQEYKNVKDRFFRSASVRNFEITEIKRIQNVPLWQSFTIIKQTVDRRNIGQQNIRHLYHGTHSDAIGNINHDGFNRIYCGKNGVMYGSGTYFAVESQYSCQDVYSRLDANGKKYIYQAAVITGQYCVGKRTYKEAPHIDGDPNKGRYDSVVDDTANPKIFVVFHDDVAYPEYLITFKKTS